jgi:ribosome-associated protein
MIVVTPRLSLADDELSYRAVLASGPGGQAVNKTSTAVELRFDAAGSPSLPDDLKARLLRLAGSRATKEGVIVLLAQTHRSQELNRRDAEARLLDLIRRAAERPKVRRPTRPTLASKTRRLEAKNRRGSVKAMRGKPGEE